MSQILAHIINEALLVTPDKLNAILSVITKRGFSEVEFASSISPQVTAGKPRQANAPHSKPEGGIRQHALCKTDYYFFVLQHRCCDDEQFKFFLREACPVGGFAVRSLPGALLSFPDSGHSFVVQTVPAHW